MNRDPNTRREYNAMIQGEMKLIFQRHQIVQCNASGLDGTEIPTPAENAMLCFRPGWKEDYVQADKTMLQKLYGMHYNAISRQSNASGLDGMQAPTASADRAIRPGLNADSNAISRQSIVSGLDLMETPTQQTKQCFRPEWNGDFNKAN